MLARRLLSLSVLGLFAVLAGACATIEKTADDPEISAGDEAGFTITVMSDDFIGIGSGEVLAVVEDPLPPQVTWAEDPDVEDCDIEGPSGAQVLTCEAILAEEGEEGDTLSVHISGLTDAEDCGLITNTAAVLGIPEVVVTSGDGTLADGLEIDSLEDLLAQGEAQGGNGPVPGPSFTATASIIVNCPELDVDKSPDGEVINPGDTASFTIDVINEGEGEADDAILTDELPAGLEWTEDSPDCTITGDTLTCNFGELAPGETASVTVTSPTDEGDCGVLFNEANATASNAEDPEGGDGNIYVDCTDGDGPGIVPGGVDLPDINVDVPESVISTPGAAAPAEDDDAGPVVSTGDGSADGNGVSNAWMLAGLAAAGVFSTGLVAFGLRRRG